MNYKGQTYHKTNFYGVQLMDQDGDWYIIIEGCDPTWYGTKRPSMEDVRYYLQMYQ